MQNEAQRNMQTGKLVQFGLLVSVLVGLLLLVIGVRQVTEGVTITEDEGFSPRMTAAPRPTLGFSEQAAEVTSEKVYLYVDGKLVEGTVVSNPSGPPSASAPSQGVQVSQGRSASR